MLKKIILYFIAIFTVMAIQFVILYIFSKDRNKNQLYINFKSIIAGSIFIAIMFTLITQFSNRFSFKVIIIILMASIVPTYWFVFDPLKYLFSKKKFNRDKDIENKIKNNGYNYTILVTNQKFTNAYATGIIPFYKIIIISKDLKEKLKEKYLKAIIYHEIGHHKNKHMLKLYFINILLQTFFIFILFKVNNLHFEHFVLKPITIFLIGSLFGFIYWFIPGKIMHKFEYQADNFSAIKNNKEDIIEALKLLDSISNGKLSKGNFTHPNLEKRIKKLKKL